jgi:hypothetical protein
MDRFTFLLRLTESADLKFLENHPAAAAKLQKARARIFRGEIRDLHREVAAVFRRRLHRIGENGRWDAYVPLLGETAGAFRSLSALALSGTLFFWGIGLPLSFPKRVAKVREYLTFDVCPVMPRA